MEVNLNLPKEVREIISTLEKSGHSAYVVGGCVRDSIMGKTPHDWDVATSALPDETEKIFSDKKLVLNGLKHGTVGVIIDHRNFEITTFRTEGDYSDNRHPDSVTFVKSIVYDLARRDFTVNAIAYSPSNGTVDPFGGEYDIKNKIIRCVGDPGKRFDEDALRIMRAVRFSAVLGFAVDAQTSAAIHSKKYLLKNIAVERIRDELEKTLTGKNVFDVLRKYEDVFFTVIPELEKTKGVPQNCVYHSYDVWEHICRSVDLSKNDRIVRLTMLLHDVAKPLMKTTDENGVDHFKMHAVEGGRIAENILRGLRFDKHTVETVAQLVLHHDDRLYEHTDNLPKYIGRYGYDFLRLLDEVSRADIKAQNNDFIGRLSLCDRFIEKLDECESKNLCVTLKQLEIDGNDLRSCGFEGKEIGELLNEALDKVISGKLENERNTLIGYIKKKREGQ